MSTQLALGLSDKEEGTARALEAKPTWATTARDWISAQLPGSLFTADDLIDAVGTPVEVGINKNNAIGAAFLAAKRLGLITPFDRVPSHRRSNHGRYIARWRRS